MNNPQRKEKNENMKEKIWSGEQYMELMFATWNQNIELPLIVTSGAVELGKNLIISRNLFSVAVFS